MDIKYIKASFIAYVFALQRLMASRHRLLHVSKDNDGAVQKHVKSLKPFYMNSYRQRRIWTRV